MANLEPFLAKPSDQRSMTASSLSIRTKTSRRVKIYEFLHAVILLDSWLATDCGYTVYKLIEKGPNLLNSVNGCKIFVPKVCYITEKLYLCISFSWY